MAKPIPFQTPAGTLNWVIITGEGKENLSGKLKYVADLVLPADSAEAKQLKEKLDTFWAENKPKGYRGKRKTSGYKMETRPVLDADGNKVYEMVDGDEVLKREETGNIVFSFSTDTTYPSGDPKVISVYNAKGNKVSLGDKKVGNGSKGQIGGAMGIYDREDGKGVTLYLNSVRILKLEEYSGDEQWGDAGGDDGWTGEDNWDSEPEQNDAPPPRL